MRFFEHDNVGCYLDGIDHRVENTKDGRELHMVDLTLRVQPFTAELAAAVDPDVRALLFNLGDGEPKHKLKAAQFDLRVTRQQIVVCLMPESPTGAIVLSDVEVTQPRARTEKGVDGFGFVFYASFGPIGSDELDYLVAWHTQQRFLTFTPQQPALDFAGAAEGDVESAPRPARRRPHTVPEAENVAH